MRTKQIQGENYGKTKIRKNHPTLVCMVKKQFNNRDIHKVNPNSPLVWISVFIFVPSFGLFVKSTKLGTNFQKVGTKRIFGRNMGCLKKNCCFLCLKDLIGFMWGQNFLPSSTLSLVFSSSSFFFYSFHF